MKKATLGTYVSGDKRINDESKTVWFIARADALERLTTDRQTYKQSFHVVISYLLMEFRAVGHVTGCVIKLQRFHGIQYADRV